MGGGEGIGPLAGSGSDHPAWGRLVNQLNWYDRKSAAAQRGLQTVRGHRAGHRRRGAGGRRSRRAPNWLVAALGAAVVLLEAVQQLYQWQTNWVLYRSTAEPLAHEGFLSCAGPYAVPIPCGCWRSGRGPTTSCVVSGTAGS
jgi:hypothetical protein